MRAYAKLRDGEIRILRILSEQERCAFSGEGERQSSARPEPEESLLLILEGAKKAHFSRRRVIDRQIQFRADNEMLPERKGMAKWTIALIPFKRGCDRANR